MTTNSNIFTMNNIVEMGRKAGHNFLGTGTGRRGHYTSKKKKKRKESIKKAIAARHRSEQLASSLESSSHELRPSETLVEPSAPLQLTLCPDVSLSPAQPPSQENLEPVVEPPEQPPSEQVVESLQHHFNLSLEPDSSKPSQDVSSSPAEPPAPSQLDPIIHSSVPMEEASLESSKSIE